MQIDKFDFPFDLIKWFKQYGKNKKKRYLHYQYTSDASKVSRGTEQEADWWCAECDSVVCFFGTTHSETSNGKNDTGDTCAQEFSRNCKADLLWIDELRTTREVV